MDDLTSIQSTGKSVDEAIFRGLQKLGISLDEAEIEIISTETKGFLGIGAKPAVVKLTKKQDDKLNVSEIMRGDFDRKPERPEKNNRNNEKREDKKPEKREEKKEKPERREEKKEKPEDKKPEKREEKKPVREEKPVKAEPDEIKNEQNVSRETLEDADAEAAEKPARQRPPKPRRDKRKPNPKPAPAENTEPAESTEPEKAEPAKVINYTLEAAEGVPAAEFVKGLIERMGASGQILAAQDEDCLRLRIDSENMGMLIGHRGETLDAMQYLTGLVINKNRKTEGYTRVTLNTEEYREKREETLKKLAKKVAAQVRATGRPRVLEPMNPYERRVLHATLQNNPDVTTHSEGEEPNRRVVVTPKRRMGRGYSKNRGTRKSFDRKPAAEPEDSGDGTISREEYERLYAAAKAASPMYATKKTEEN